VTLGGALPAGVAAGHPATAQAGLEILDAGGTAADAAVGASLASCVAETVMTGFLGGGHALHWDVATEAARNLDCFCAVPGLDSPGPPAAMERIDVPFGEELLHYAIGPSSCGVPGLPAGLAELHRAHGRLPWPDVVAPALRLAREGVLMPPEHADCLRMLAPVMTMGGGEPIYAPRGKVLEAGDMLRQPGLVRTLELVAEEGAETVYRGTIGRELQAFMAERRGALTPADFEAYEARWTGPVALAYAGHRVLTRAGLSGVPSTLRRLPRLRDLSPAERVVVLVETFAAHDHSVQPHTTNLVTVDEAGNACVLTSSLGLGSGDFLPGYDLHLNSMLGEIDLLVTDLQPGGRMESMMAPTLALDGDGPALAIGSAGGTRLRTALVAVTAGILDERCDPRDAAERPRLHPAGDTVNAEPGLDEDGLSELERRGWHVRRWSARHHYFGGVSLVARAGPAADPRRGGAALALR
jgi:gamma-glutamyltranspeptidase / glutathione hydrolase